MELCLRLAPHINIANFNKGTNRRINFQVKKLIGYVLGFKPNFFEDNNIHELNKEVKILKMNTIFFNYSYN